MMRRIGGQVRSRGWQAGFTLVEMLVVIVILMILLGLLFVPMYQSFQATKRAETAAVLQDRVGTAVQQLVKDLEEAVYVYPPPAPGLYRSPTVPDAVYLSFLDIRKPATEGEIATDYSGGAYTYGNRDKVAYPIRPSDRIVRYFVAPLPGHPVGAGMWGDAPVPPARAGYVNTFLDAFSDDADRNLVVLYRAEFSLAEIENTIGAPAGTVSLASLQTPYFYTGAVLGAGGALDMANAAALGAYWKAVSMSLTDKQSMDCALYEYDGAVDDEVPVMVAGDASVLAGALPGLFLQPKVVLNETLDPSQIREATAYRGTEPFWGNLDLDTNPAWSPASPMPLRPLSQVNSTRGGGPLGAIAASYTALAAAAWTVPTADDSYMASGGAVLRLYPKLDPVTGQLRFARRWTDVYHETISGATVTIDTPPDYTGCLQIAQAPSATAAPSVYRVGYGLFRGDALDGGGVAIPVPSPASPPLPTVRTPATPFNARDHFRMVKESEIVQLRDVQSGQTIQCERVETEPVGPFQYRIDYDTGAIRFDRLNPPDPSLYWIRVDYDFRDNFEWSPGDVRGFVDDTIVATYVSRREMTVGLNVTGYDISSGEAIPVPVSRVVRLRNAIQ